MSDLSAITENLNSVKDRIRTTSSNRTQELKDINLNPRLVVVSKTKPKECIFKAYEGGQRHFGENYVQELIDKATDPELQKLCPDIQWHFIGHLQRNKTAKLIYKVKNLFAVETVDSEGLAKCLNEAVHRGEDEKRLNVMVQVNTSGEESKSGVEPNKCLNLVKYVMTECQELKFMGLMTIGAIASSHADPMHDFQFLLNLREEVCTGFDLDRKDVELSMGMSGDFEEAILGGSTNVRVGSTIFGARTKKPNSE